MIDSRQVSGGNFDVCQADSVFPQTIVIDLGKIQPDLDVLIIVQNHRCEPKPQVALAEGNVTKCKLYASKNNIDFEEVATQSWKPDAN